MADSSSRETQHTLTGPFEQARGVIGRYPKPDEAYVFEFNTVRKRHIHMFGVPEPLEVEFYIDGGTSEVDSPQTVDRQSQRAMR